MMRACTNFSRKQFQTELLRYAAFLVYATFWPFDFHFAQGLAAPRKISWIPFFNQIEGLNRKDAVMNILVFLPFGGVLSFLANSASATIRRPVLIAAIDGNNIFFYGNYLTNS